MGQVLQLQLPMGTTSGIGTGRGIMSGGKGRSCARAARVLRKGYQGLLASW